MSGVIDDKGQQWEHCCDCGKLVRMDNLGYLPPSKAHPHGLDLCLHCVGKLSQKDVRRIKPAASWVKKYS